MNPHQDHDEREFEDFLKRRQPLFRHAEDESLEPPAELDRLVLRQAREAISGDRPQRMFRAPRWGAPLAIAATLVLGLTFVFKAGLPTTTELRPQVTVENIAQRAEVPAEAAAPAAAADAPAFHQHRADDPVVVQLSPPAQGADAGASIVREEEVRREASPSPPPPIAPRSAVARAATGSSPHTAATDSAPGEVPAWRREAGSWLAEIERRRAAGDIAGADAEMAEYNRQHRALAVSPDR
jgi:hypothetical protein